MCHCSWEIAPVPLEPKGYLPFCFTGTRISGKVLKKAGSESKEWEKCDLDSPGFTCLLAKKKSCKSCVTAVAKTAKLREQELHCPLSHETPRSSPFSQHLCRSCSFHMVKKVHATLWCFGHHMYHICRGPQMKIAVHILIRLRSAVTEVVTLYTHPRVFPASSTLRSTFPKSPGWKPISNKQVRTRKEYCQEPFSNISHTSMSRKHFF